MRRRPWSSTVKALHIPPDDKDDDRDDDEVGDGDQICGGGSGGNYDYRPLLEWLV